jgi:ABC-type polysaccharide/polyol phosphate export permease
VPATWSILIHAPLLYVVVVVFMSSSYVLLFVWFKYRDTAGACQGLFNIYMFASIA